MPHTLTRGTFGTELPPGGMSLRRGPDGLRRRSGPALRLGAARFGQFFLPWFHRTVRIFETELAVAGLVGDDNDPHVAAALETSEQHFVGERLLDVLLDHPRHRPGTHKLVVAVGDQPFGGFVGQLDGDVAVGELRFELQHEFLDHHGDDLGRQMREGDDGVEPVAEFRREHPVDRLHVVTLALGPREAERRPRHIRSAGIGGHDQDHMAEVDLLAAVVGQLAVIHDLQEHIEHVRMRLLDFVEQKHAMRMLIDAVGQKPALVEADIAGRRADQPRDGVALHIFRHVKADQLDAERRRELFGHFGLADAGRPREQVTADRLFRLAQPGAGKLDRCGQRLDGLVLTVDHALERLFEVPEHLGVVFGDRLGRNPRHGRDRRFDLFQSDGPLAPVFRQQHLRRAQLVDHIDRLVGQLAVMDVTRRKLDRRLNRVAGIFELVIILEIGLQPFEDLDGVGNRRLVDVDLLEAADQCTILFEILPVLFIRRRTDAAHRAGRQRGL